MSLLGFRSRFLCEAWRRNERGIARGTGGNRRDCVDYGEGELRRLLARETDMREKGGNYFFDLAHSRTHQSSCSQEKWRRRNATHFFGGALGQLPSALNLATVSLTTSVVSLNSGFHPTTSLSFLLLRLMGYGWRISGACEDGSAGDLEEGRGSENARHEARWGSSSTWEGLKR